MTRLEKQIGHTPGILILTLSFIAGLSFVNVSANAYGQNSSAQTSEDTSLTDCEIVPVNSAVANISSSTMGNYYSNKRPASNAIDLDIDTRWSSRGNGSSIQLDLNGVKPICAIGVSWFDGSNRSYNFMVSLSNDTGSTIHLPSTKSAGVSNSSEIYPIVGLAADSISLTVNGSNANNYAHINELTVFSK